MISQGAKNLYTFDWLFGFTMSIFVYTALSWIFPAKTSLSEMTIYGHDIGEGIGVGSETSDVEGSMKGGVGEKGMGEKGVVMTTGVDIA